jgi:hypothetical protein
VAHVLSRTTSLLAAKLLLKYCLASFFQPQTASMRAILLERQVNINSLLIVPVERVCAELDAEMKKVGCHPF